jgi:hypothetical protein
MNPGRAVLFDLACPDHDALTSQGGEAVQPTA